MQENMETVCRHWWSSQVKDKCDLMFLFVCCITGQDGCFQVESAEKSRRVRWRGGPSYSCIACNPLPNLFFIPSSLAACLCALTIEVSRFLQSMHTLCRDPTTLSPLSCIARNFSTSDLSIDLVR